ncbi:nucleotidyltransferase AbiEii toxin of type IV toxin-antitoxin system [Spirosoma oryzae]|uniref:Nucleotidyltransferase AbiEii toxin of type IV toxin-antitoxin system n=2 Tax=Spirosoma oryzae TaxID=1469603 RepID=A0A2T0SQ22_9BACT|nr:nucleotidyltransferase AbiEii toxin of type IV toxin-antitoxin system [Spirosoma oryzae]
MLYPATVAPDTLELLRQLMQLPALDSFALAGGTNLALRYGHRLSIDLDLFTDQSFSTSDVIDELVRLFPETIVTDESKNSVSLFIRGVKVDLLAHRYPLLQPFENMEQIRFWSVDDVIAMKLSAVSGRGAKKDFWDIAELLNQYTLPQMLHFFTRKYPNSDPGYVIRSLTYFDDAEQQVDPVEVNTITWPEVKQRITQAVRRLL